MIAYGILFLAWLGYYGLHSALAHPPVKQWIQTKLGSGFRFYRIAFNILSLLLLVPLIGAKFWLPTELFLPEPLWIKIVGGIFSLFGSYVLIDAFLTVNLSHFVGIHQMKDKESKPNQIAPRKLIRKGWYAWVRHPFYFGVLLILSGIVLMLPSWSVLMMYLATLLYLPVGVTLEEKKLILEFGDDYLKYRKEVKAIVPFLF